MKKFLFFLFSVIFLSVSPSLSFAQNKCGVNIGPYYQQANQVRDLVGEGGWIVALGSPGDCAGFESLFGKGLNVVIRAYNGGQEFTNKQALGWVATLGKLNTQGQKVYFMPWNEPNHQNEGGGSNAGEKVYQYVEFLKENLEEAGLFNTKVILLSPMVDKLNSSFESFFNNLGGKSAFYNLSSGSSINEYDQFSPGPCSAATNYQNNCQYDQIGIPAPFYALEAGVAGTCTPPCYQDKDIAQMLNASWEKWKSDGQFKMFAVFSYDPHRPSLWNIFEAPETTAFYRSHCSQGNVNFGGYNTVTFNQWLENHQDELISCGTCGWAPSREYCQGTGGNLENQEPEIIPLKDGLVSTDFEIDYQKETIQRQPTPTPATASSSALGTSQTLEKREDFLRGNLKMSQKTIPDFSQMENIFSSALTKMLPQNLKKTLSINEKTLEGATKHYIYGTKKGDQGSIEKVSGQKSPEETFRLDSWWTSLIGKSKVLCGVFGTCPPPKSLSLEIKTNEEYFPPEGIGDGRKALPAKEKETKEINSNPSFEVKTSFLKKITETIEEIIKNFFGWVKRTETNTTLINETRGVVPGAENINQNSSFLDAFIPAKEAPGTKNGPLKIKTSFEAQTSDEGTLTLKEGSEHIKYHNLGAAQKRYCLSLCSQIPDTLNISEIDPLCPSCNPNDYSLEGFGDIPLKQDLCQPNPSGGCDYYLPHDPSLEGCGEGQDANCEGGRCNPYEINPDRDYDKCGGPQWGTCYNESVCYKMTFAKNEKGGYGECNYANPVVCVRADRLEVGQCAAVCNWECCAHQ